MFTFVNFASTAFKAVVVAFVFNSAVTALFCTGLELVADNEVSTIILFAPSCIEFNFVLSASV